MRRSLRDWVNELRERARSEPYDETRRQLPFKDIFAIIIAMFQLASPLLVAVLVVAVVVALILTRG
jgi:hypothetical protein